MVKLKNAGKVVRRSTVHAERILQLYADGKTAISSRWILVDESFIFEDNKLKYVSKRDKGTDKKSEKQGGSK